jgi:hypothetical protein
MLLRLNDVPCSFLARYEAYCPGLGKVQQLSMFLSYFKNKTERDVWSNATSLGCYGSRAVIILGCDTSISYRTMVHQLSLLVQTEAALREYATRSWRISNILVVQSSSACVRCP